jgi:hypothetical protein
MVHESTKKSEGLAAFFLGNAPGTGDGADLPIGELQLQIENTRGANSHAFIYLIRYNELKCD